MHALANRPAATVTTAPIAASPWRVAEAGQFQDTVGNARALQDLTEAQALEPQRSAQARASDELDALAAQLGAGLFQR